MSRSVFGDASEQLEFSDEADPSEVASLLRYAGTGIRVLTECLSSTHTNFALARRDALLLQPNQATPAAMRSLLRTLPLTSDSLFGPLSAEFLRTAQQAKKEEFVFKAATAALLPQPKPWGVKAAGAKRKASHPPIRRICACQHWPGTTPYLPLLCQSGRAWVGSGVISTSLRPQGANGGVSLQGLTPNDLPPIRLFPRKFPLQEIYRTTYPSGATSPQTSGYWGYSNRGFVYRGQMCVLH